MHARTFVQCTHNVFVFMFMLDAILFMPRCRISQETVVAMGSPLDSIRDFGELIYPYTWTHAHTYVCTNNQLIEWRASTNSTAKWNVYHHMHVRLTHTFYFGTGQVNILSVHTVLVCMIQHEEAQHTTGNKIVWFSVGICIFIVASFKKPGKSCWRNRLYKHLRSWISRVNFGRKQ